jgi:hypothetical protein
MQSEEELYTDSLLTVTQQSSFQFSEQFLRRYYFSKEEVNTSQSLEQLLLNEIELHDNILLLNRKEIHFLCSQVLNCVPRFLSAKETHSTREQFLMIPKLFKDLLTEVSCEHYLSMGKNEKELLPIPNCPKDCSKPVQDRKRFWKPISSDFSRSDPLFAVLILTLELLFPNHYVKNCAFITSLPDTVDQTMHIDTRAVNQKKKNSNSSSPVSFWSEETCYVGFLGLEKVGSGIKLALGENGDDLEAILYYYSVGDLLLFSSNEFHAGLAYPLATNTRFHFQLQSKLTKAMEEQSAYFSKAPVVVVETRSTLP